MKIKEIDVRGNSRSLKFEMNVENVIGKNLQNITKIGSYNVYVRAPLLDSHSVGVISLVVLISR